MHHVHIDRMAYQDSCVHRLDPRAKLCVTLLFTAVVLSLPRLAVSPVLCFAVGPFALLVLADVSLGAVLKRTLLASPFVLLLGLACPYYDRSPMRVYFGPLTWDTTTGWVRCASLYAKYGVSMFALLCLTSTTRFADLLMGLQRLKVPQVLVTQLGFLYRQLFLLVDQAHRLRRARQTRHMRFLGLSGEISVAGSMLGSLLVRSLDRAERVSLAMHARGFSGRWSSTPGTRLKPTDWWFSGLSLMAIAGLTLLLYRTML